ncbi:hypothetical protein [Haloferula helveola]
MTEAKSKPEPHPSIAATAISGMALVLALVLHLIGPLRGVDDALAAWVTGLPMGGEIHPSPPFLVWVWTVLLVIGLPQSVLHVRGQWRRWVLVVSALVLTLSWVPVLALAGVTVPVAAPLAALIWASGGSLIYAVRHREPT